MQKTENVGNILTEIIRRNDFEPKMIELRVFDLWRTHVDAPFNTYAAPVSLSAGVLKIYTEHPACKSGILFQKPKIIADLNAELEHPILTDLRIELRPVQTASSHNRQANPSESSHESSSSQPAGTDAPRHATPQDLEQIEQTLANVTDARLKKSLRQLFTTQSEDNP